MEPLSIGRFDARVLPRVFVSLVLSLLLASFAGLTGCAGDAQEQTDAPAGSSTAQLDSVDRQSSTEADADDDAEALRVLANYHDDLDLSQVPAYAGSASVAIDGDTPHFSDEEKSLGYGFKAYEHLDGLGRCGAALAVVGDETMPTTERGDIGMVKPSGWRTARYDGLVDGDYLYNRCHLIGYQLSGENANEENLITGTRYMNTEGMLPFEDEVNDYVDETGNHVLYRATPVFEGDELVARGVHLEALSLEDGGAGVSFNVFCYNVQPGVEIDYATGDSWRAEAQAASPSSDGASAKATEATYILNTNTKKFHRSGCSAINQMKDSNKQSFTGSRDDLIAQGYTACKKCNP